MTSHQSQVQKRSRLVHRRGNHWGEPIRAVLPVHPIAAGGKAAPGVVERYLFNWRQNDKTENV